VPRRVLQIQTDYVSIAKMQTVVRNATRSANAIEKEELSSERSIFRAIYAMTIKLRKDTTTVFPSNFGAEVARPPVGAHAAQPSGSSFSVWIISTSVNY
jgi:hypothetical protein